MSHDTSEYMVRVYYPVPDLRFCSGEVDVPFNRLDTAFKWLDVLRARGVEATLFGPVHGGIRTVMAKNVVEWAVS